ncbi:MAG: cbb3-type cytochrome c oxidase subunit 3 [Gammaproteobacteria bacterium]|nr:MAG: cbb3-type cytochrome c oxidase subunit 3 [Gammaproteobacteria bacterium]
MVWFHAFFTVFLILLFVAIVLWAYSPRRKKAFDEAARLPLEDEQGDHP